MVDDEDDIGAPIPIVLSFVGKLGDGCTFQQVLELLAQEGLTCDEMEFDKAYRFRYGGEVGDMNRLERRKEIDKIMAQVGPEGAFDKAKELADGVGIELDMDTFRKSRLRAGFPKLRPGAKLGKKATAQRPSATAQTKIGFAGSLDAKIAELEKDIECLRRARELLDTRGSKS